MAEWGSGCVGLSQQVAKPTILSVLGQSALQQFEEFWTVKLNNGVAKIVHPNRAGAGTKAFPGQQFPVPLMQGIEPWVQLPLAQDPFDLLCQLKEDKVGGVLWIYWAPFFCEVCCLRREVLMAVRQGIEPGLRRFQKYIVDGAHLNTWQLKEPTPVGFAVFLAIFPVTLGTAAEEIRWAHSVGARTGPDSYG
jgi:hypothetical protein